MKTCEYCLDLPFLEVVEKIQYELRWGYLKTTADSHRIPHDNAHFFVIYCSVSEIAVILIKQVQNCVYLSITEPENTRWAILLGELFLHHRIPSIAKPH